MAATSGPEARRSTAAEVPHHFTPLQVRTIIFCFLLFLVDGADVLVVSYAAPALSTDWGLTQDRLGFLFSAGLAGMTVGALTLAPLSDRFGRKAMIIVTLLIVGGGMVASAFATKFTELILLRFLAGLGIGSMLASITALAAEFAPLQRREALIALCAGGYPVGAILSGFAATAIMPLWGWRGLFFGAGAMSLFLLPLALFCLPESLGFLAERQPRGALKRINRMRTAMNMTALQHLPPVTAASRTAGVSALLSPLYRASTLLIWGTFFFTFMTLYFLTSWVPKIAMDAGLPVAQAIYAGAAFNGGALLGIILLGWFKTRLRLNRIIILFFAGGSISMLTFALVHQPLSLLFAELLIMGLFIQGGFSALYAVAARTYPTAMRTTGVGWSLGAGRLGAVFGPMLGGLIMAAGVTLTVSFLIFAVPMVLAGLLLWLLNDPEEQPALAVVPA